MDGGRVARGWRLVWLVACMTSPHLLRRQHLGKPGSLEGGGGAHLRFRILRHAIRGKAAGGAGGAAAGCVAGE
eukprot:7242992-Prymnesium_polylepis.1